MKSEVVDALLFHYRVNLLKKIAQIERIKFRQLVKLLVRNNNQLGLALPVEIETRQAALIVQVSVWCIFLLALGAVTLTLVRITWRTGRIGLGG